MKNRIFLLTGAAGNLGSNIVRQIIESGYPVRALVLKGDPARKYVPSQAEIIEGDLLDMKSLDRFFDTEQDYPEAEVFVIHCASMVTVDPTWNQKVYAVNVIGTENIIAQCAKHKVEKLVYVSSTGAIPELPGNQPIHEVKKFDQDKVVGCYSKTKAEASQIVLDAVKEQGLQACIVHPSGIIGPNDYAFGEAATVIAQIANGEMPGGIAGSFNMVDVRDLAKATIQACEHGKLGECYILSNECVTLKEFYHLVSDAAGSKPVKLFLPGKLAMGIAKILEIHGKKAKKTNKKSTGIASVLTTFAVYNLIRNNNYDCSKARKDLNFKTRSYADTIRDEVVWLKAEGKIRV